MLAKSLASTELTLGTSAGMTGLGVNPYAGWAGTG